MSVQGLVSVPQILYVSRRHWANIVFSPADHIGLLADDSDRIRKEIYLLYKNRNRPKVELDSDDTSV